MAKFLPSFGFGKENKGGLEGVEFKDASTQRAAQGRGFVYANQPYTPPGADIDRMVRDGYEKVIWAFKAIDAIADKLSGWPIKCMEGVDPEWRAVDDPILPLLNAYANEIERSAKYFRYRLISQLLLSKKGVFVEAIPSKSGAKVAALNLLPPGMTSPIPDGDKFIAGFRVETPGAKNPHIDLPVYDAEKKAGVIWIRKPHPTDPYSSVTPLESAGISLDLDFYARLYNRNFLLNDGRAGQLVAVKGGLSPEDAQELKARFSPGMGGAGRTTVIEADSVSVQDTAISPRDAQYAELRNITKEDLLIALGTPESVIGNASGRTFDNADAEKENWLDVTVLPLSQVIQAGFDVLTKGGWGDERQLVHDVSGEPVLRRRHEAKVDKARADCAAGYITIDEYRAIAELEPLARPGSRVLWVNGGGKVAVGKDEADETAAGELKPLGGAPDAGMLGGDPAAAGDLSGFDAELNALLATPGAPTALGQAVGEVTTASWSDAMEVKAFNPQQPRYPQGHPQGGAFMDLGDISLWLSGKPLKDGSPSSGVADPNQGSTASPGGAARFTTHADPKVRAAAALITFPAGYSHPRVLGAPPAVDLPSPKSIKVTSLRKGDVVEVHGKDLAVAEAKRTRSGAIELALVADDGSVTNMTAQPGMSARAVARTPHPQVVAQAKRDVAAAARAMAGGGAPAPQAAPAAAPAPGTYIPSTPGVPGGYAISPPPPAAAPAAPAAPQVGQQGPFTLPLAAGYYTNTTTGAVIRVSPSGRGGFWPTPGGAQQPLTPSATAKALTKLPPVGRGNDYTFAGATKPASVTRTAPAAPTPAPAAPAAPAASLPSRPVSKLFPGQKSPFQYAAPGIYDAPNGAVMTVFADGSSNVTVQGRSTNYPAGHAGSVLTDPQGPAWTLVTLHAPPVPTPATAGPVFALPPAPAGAVIYAHPSGKHIYVLPGGGMEVWKPDGKRGSSSATPAKLAAGHGQWTRVAAPATGPRAAGAAAPTTAPAAPAAATTPTPQPAAVAPTFSPPPAPAPTPASSSRAAAVIAKGVPQVAVTSSTFSVTTGQGSGSNPASHMTDSAGKRWYVKSLGAKQADNETAAARIYAAAGVQVPEVHRATLQAGQFSGQKGGHGIASPIVAGTPDMSQRMAQSRSFRDAVLEDFAVHAWLGNWDAVENNNTMTGANGKPLTVDVGGSMAFRARGGARKVGGSGAQDFGPVVRELSSMRTGPNTGSSARGAFGQLTPDHTDARFVAGVERIAAISPAQIQGLVQSSYPSLSPKERTTLADTLIARRADLAAKARVTLPETRQQAAPTAPTPAAPTPAPAAPAAPAPAAPAAPAPAAPAAPAPAAAGGNVPLPGGVGPFSIIAPGVYVNTAGTTLTVHASGDGTLTRTGGQQSQVAASTVHAYLQGPVQGPFWTMQSITTTPAPAPTPTPAAPAAPAAPAPAAGGPSPHTILTPPPGYPYPIVSGAPVATALPTPRGIKVASLRKGDVVQYSGVNLTVVSVDRKTNNIVTVNSQGQNVRLFSSNHPSGTVLAVARTPHPQIVAQARRQLAAQQAAPAAPAAPAPAPAVAGPAYGPVANVVRTVPAAVNGPAAATAARRYGTAQQGGYAPVPGQTYATPSGSVLVVHSDGTGSVSGASSLAPTDLTRADVERLLDTGTVYVPVGPQLTTSAYSIDVGRHANPNGDTVDVHVDGTGTLTLANGTVAPLTEQAVDQLVNPSTATMPQHTFGFAGPSPHPRAPRPQVPAPAAASLVGAQAPAGGWGPAGQIVPGATFVLPSTGATLTIGPRGGGQMVAGGQRRNMSSASAQSALNKRGTQWRLQTPGPSATVAASPAPAAPTVTPVPAGAGAPMFQAPPAPIPSVGGAPVFASGVGAPATGFTSYLQPGQRFINTKTGSVLVINTDGTGDLTIGARARGGTGGRKSVAQTMRALAAQGWVGDSGPDIDAPGDMHAAAVRKALRQAALPPVGTPIRGGAPSGRVSYPAAATGSTTLQPAANLARGQTVRVAGEDWIVTETVVGKGGTEIWGYRPGVDDPLTIVRDKDDKWHQGSVIPGTKGVHSVDVVGPAPAPATNVPTNGSARNFDPALPAPTATTGVGANHGAGFTVTSQLVDADLLKAGDVILLNGREAEGTFVVTEVKNDHKGRPAVYGYGGTTADAAGVPGTPDKLFLVAPGATKRQARVQVNGAPPPLPEVPRPIPPKAASSIERNDISDATSQAKVRDIMIGSAAHGNAAGATAVGDRKAAHLMALRGYNAHPDVVSEKELDDYIADGEIEIFRGMRGSTKSHDLAEDYRSGKHYPGGMGGSMFGVGAYAAYGVSSSSSSAFHSTKDGLTFAQQTYGSGHGGVVMRMTIKGDARVAEFDNLFAEMRREASSNPVVAEMARHGKTGVGHYAVYKGYDIIRKSGAYRGGSKGNKWDAGFVVILNRSAVRVSDKNYVGDGYVSGAPAGPNPPPVPYSRMRNRMDHRTAKHAGDVDYKIKGEP